ncbi:Hypothetical predicted protein [Mytilus galloprovincialis]|uniref:Uncharacterized protein n=1 Tax=Mytilus galloprovincialis TaxID=29158 RepID=A0A8B6EE64_MYTGA|nr:Hypothetical predicted protein [Mytilus galloprovincialis]
MGRHNKANVQAYRQRRKIKKRHKKKLLKQQTSDKAVITLKQSCDIEELEKKNCIVSENMSGIHVNTEKERFKSIESQSTESSRNLDFDTDIEDLDKTNYNVSEVMSGIHVNTEKERCKSIESQSTKSSENLDSDTESLDFKFDYITALKKILVDYSFEENTCG